MSKHERTQHIDVNEEEVHTPRENKIDRSKAEHVTIEHGIKSLVRRKRLLIAPIALVIAILCAWFIRGSVLYEHTDDVQINGEIMPMTARINGQIQQVNASEGQVVHAGDILAVIDQREHSLAVYKALADLAYAENTAASWYYNAAITATIAFGTLNSAQDAVKNAQSEVAVAVYKLRADKAALKPDGVMATDRLELLDLQEKLLEAIDDLRQAQTAPQQVSLARTKAQAADSEVMQGKALLEQGQLNLSYTIIRSSVTGIVGKRRIEVGQNVSVGQDLIDVVSLDDVWITANFKEKQLANVRPGEPVEIKVDAYGRIWKGHVTNLGASAGSVFSGTNPEGAIGKRPKAMQRVAVRIDFDRPQSQDFNANDLLKPGLSAELRVRIRWPPRSGSPHKYSGSRGPTAGLSTPWR
jgi:membrane fusion protein, multidrug efflux system